MVFKKDLWEQLDLPDETCPGQVLVEIAGDRRVLIERHQGIREYCPERITVQVPFGWIQITGCSLELKCIAREQLVICGRIDGILLKRRRSV